MGRGGAGEAEVIQARKQYMRGFISFAAPLKKGGSRELDPVSVLMGNVQNKIFDFSHYVEDVQKAFPYWPLEKIIAHLEMVTGTPYADAEEYKAIEEGNHSGIVRSRVRSLTESAPSVSDAGVIIWVQGSIKDDTVQPTRKLGPLATVEKLKMDVPMELAESVTEWHANAWPGGSPTRMLEDVRDGREVPQVFWTKNIHEEKSDFTISWLALQDMLGSMNPLTQYVYKMDGRDRHYSDLLRHVTQWLTVATAKDFSTPPGHLHEARYVHNWWRRPLAMSVRWRSGSTRSHRWMCSSAGSGVMAWRTHWVHLRWYPVSSSRMIGLTVG
uniref:Uncharacterized protein n=1 Tax=viral metagenome TaxID=1070528 RepID=A0A2V0RK16_9ZZZZ